MVSALERESIRCDVRHRRTGVRHLGGGPADTGQVYGHACGSCRTNGKVMATTENRRAEGGVAGSYQGGRTHLSSFLRLPGHLA